MRLAFPKPSSDWRRPSPRQRALAIALTLCAELIFVILFLGLAPKLIEQVEDFGEPLTFDLAPPAPKAAPRPKPKAQATKSASASAQRRPIASPLPPTKPLQESPLVELIKEDPTSSDIAKLGTRGTNSGSAAGRSASTMGPGAGPGGAQLYNAEWVVEPTDAELANYMPNGAAAGSSAEIACKMIENYRVENCRMLSESPMGSGLVRAMRLASWQFKVRPPRIDGKPPSGCG